MIISTLGQAPWKAWTDENLETGTAPVKEWFHVTAVFRQGAVYFNGVKSEYTYIGNNSDGLPYLIVGRKLDRPGHWADAWIKEVKVFDKALTDAQVQDESDSFFGIIRTNTVGGSGGIPFDDKHTPWKYGRIVQIEVNYGNWIDYIKIAYENGQSFSHGKKFTDSTDIIDLDENQYISRVSGREVKYSGIRKIAFETNDGVLYGPYGYTDEGESFQFDFDGNALFYIFGSTDSHEKVFQLGFAYVKSSTVNDHIYEAEDPSNVLGDSEVNHDNHGYTGSGYVNMGGEGSWIEWPAVSAGDDGACTLKFRYAVANPSTTHTRPCQILVNEVGVGTVAFPRVGETWSDYSIDSLNIVCPEGSFKVRLVATSSNGGPNVDSLEVVGS